MQQRDERGGHESRTPSTPSAIAAVPPTSKSDHGATVQHAGEPQHDRGNRERRRSVDGWRRRSRPAADRSKSSYWERREGLDPAGGARRCARSALPVRSRVTSGRQHVSVQHGRASEAAAFSDPTFPCIGSETRRSQCSRTSREMPDPSLPRTNATRPVGHALVVDRARRVLVKADHREAGVLEPLDRAGEIRDPRVGQVQQRAGGRTHRRRR